MSEVLEKLEKSIVDLNKDEALTAAKEIVDEKQIEAKLALDAVTKALDEIGKLYETEEYYLAELVYAGEIAKQVLALLHPYLVGSESEEKDQAKRVIIGTIKGDMHDLGKNIVRIFARGAGYEIIDLGSDVSPEAFTKKLKEENIKILGLSCLLTACDSQIGNTLAALKKEGLSDVKIIIGGAAMTEKFAADLEKEYGITTKFAPDAITGIKIFNELID